VPKFVADSSVSPTGLKWAVDPVADVVTTAGDLIYGTAADTVARLGIGTAGQLLAVNSGATAPEWVAAPSSGGMTLLATTTLSGGTTTISGISGSYKDLLLIFRGVGCNGNTMGIRVNGITTSSYYGIATTIDSGNANGTGTWRSAQTSMVYREALNQDTNNTGYLKIYDYANTGAAMKFMESVVYDEPGERLLPMQFVNYDLVSAALTSVTFLSASGTISGTVLTYGVS